jgi:hypothetical protein
MPKDERAVWLAASLRTPFVGVDGPFAHRDSLALSVPVVQAMAPQVDVSNLRMDGEESSLFCFKILPL